MNYNEMKKLLFGIVITIFLIFSANSAKASSSDEGGKFNPGTFIIDHIVDSYGWHITDIGGHSISISLPVILFDDGKPVVFMSGNFHHGKNAYKGYAIGFTPDTKGKIVKLAGANAGYSGEISELSKEMQISDAEGMQSLIDAAASASLIDISITKNVCSLFISIILLCWLFLHIAKKYKHRENMAPKGAQSLFEPVILFVRDEIAIPSIGENKYQKFFPYLLTLFFFILINNMMGLVPIFPGGANVTGNIAITGILALITFLITTFSSNKNYWVHIFNTPGVPWWLKFPLPLMPIVELIGIFTKPFVLMIRLFANITAGHIIVLGFIGLIFIFGEMAPALGYGVSIISLIFYLFMGLLELIVAFVQAFVFTLLTALFVGMAMEEEHEESHEKVSTVEISK
ncbi:MAG TPA: F0F1 ATP synthase subunit A [Bacteroidales bacterium]|nr:F0F1 ATP synthase subunit A [Bacteroidales bacterium]HPT52734.1 F0F1 ATP synthase subunit A [Bacteroidales bacterium]